MPGAMANEVPAMHPTITCKPNARASRASASASVSPPVLSSLTFTTWYKSLTAASPPRSASDSSAASLSGPE